MGMDVGLIDRKGLYDNPFLSGTGDLEKYGPYRDQTAFMIVGHQTIENLVMQLKELKGDKSSLAEVFNEVLTSLGSTRKMLAEHAKSKHAERFGVLRLDEDSALPAFTPIHGKAYKSYKEHFLTRLTTILDGFEHDMMSFSQTEHVMEAECMGYALATRVRVINYEDVPAFVKTSKEKLEGILHATGGTMEEFSRGATKVWGPMKEDELDEYTSRLNLIMLQEIRSIYPEKKMSFWLEMCPSLNGRNLSRVFSFGYCTGSKDPVDYMRENAELVIMHGEPLDIEALMEEAQRHFVAACSWTPAASKAELITFVGAMRYFIAHAMPFKRGSAAVGEWLERIVFGIHDFSMHMRRPGMVDMEALTESWNMQEFITNYLEIVELGPKYEAPRLAPDEAHPVLLHSREKFGYFHDQEDYNRRKNLVIEAALMCLSDTALADTNTLFDRLFGDFCKVRQAIAKEHGTAEWRDFGKPRIVNGIFSVGFPHQILAVPSYASTNKHVTEKLAAHLTTVGWAGGEYFSRTDSDYDRRRTTVDIKIQKGIPKDLLPLEENLYAGGWKPSDGNPTEDTLFSVEFQRNQKYGLIDPRSKAHYVSLKAITAWDVVAPHIGELEEPLMLTVTNRVDLDKPRYGLSEMRCFLEGKDGPEATLTQLSNHGKMVVMFQDNFLVDPTMAEVKRLFGEAMRWDGADIEVLKDFVGQMRYLMAQAMPIARGTAAVGEWLEETIYRKHGQSPAHPPGKVIDVAALSAFGMAEFMAAYKEELELTPFTERK